MRINKTLEFADAQELFRVWYGWGLWYAMMNRKEVYQMNESVRFFSEVLNLMAS